MDHTSSSSETPQSGLVDTLIISDLHLGSEVSLAKDARRMLKSRSFRRLILLGDIFCDLNFRRLKKDHWEFLSYIRKLSNPKRDVEVVWVEGNHDQGLADLMSHLVGVPVHQEYTWTFAGQRYLAIHGHQFDRFIINNAALSALGAFLYIHLQKLDSERKCFTRFLDRLNSRWLRLSSKIAADALAYAKLRGANTIFCGHTHHAMESEKAGIHYFNSGCWANTSPTYISVDEAGVQVHDYWSEAQTPDAAEAGVEAFDEP
jgi:UDP-2,3-diacylglucosamine pyrophosphatase LpxH